MLKRFDLYLIGLVWKGNAVRSLPFRLLQTT